MNGHLGDMDVSGQKGILGLQNVLSDGDNHLSDGSYMNGHSTEGSAEESESLTNNNHPDRLPGSAFPADSSIADSRLGSDSAAGAVQMDEPMPQEQSIFSIPSTGFYVKRTEIVKTYERVTVSEQYYENGTLAFASRPTVQDREMESKQDVQILPCDDDQFQEARTKSVLAHEVAADAHGTNGSDPVIQEPSEADDVSFAGSDVRSSKKAKSRRNMSLLSEDEDSPVKEESSSSTKKTRQSSARGRKPIGVSKTEVSFPSLGAHVLAGYNDNKYYSAKITAKAGRANTFEVRYLDTKEDSTVHESMLLDPAVWLTVDRPVLVKVNRETASGDYEAGVIMEMVSEDDKLPRYKVKIEADSSEKIVDAAVIALDDDEVLKHKFDKTSNAGTAGKKEGTSSKTKTKSVSVEPSRAYFIGEMVYAQWKTSSRYYPGKISDTPSEETSKYKVKYLDGDEEEVAPNEIILADDLVKPGMDADVERTGHPYAKVTIKEVKGSGEDIEAVVEHKDTRQETVHLTELTFASKDARRVLSGKPLPATPTPAPSSARRSDLRASTRTTASPAKKPEVKSTPKTPKVKKPSVPEEVEPVSSPSGEHEVDTEQVFRIGKEHYYKGEQIFAQWDTDRRWYAATIGGVRAGKYRIDWCENDQVNYVIPDQVIRARDALVKGTKINVIAEGKSYYDEVIFETFSEDGNHLCQQGRGVTVARKFNTMMIQQKEGEKIKAKQGATLGSSSQKSSTSEKEKSTPTTSGRKRPVSPTMEPSSSSARNGVKQAKKATPEPAEVADPAPLKDCAFIVTSGAEKDASFDREYLIGQIERMGGGVLSTFEDLSASSGKRFLVSPNACRTAKYLQCLAAGIPCISHKYIIDLAASGAKKGKVGFEAYRLPAGKSSTNGNNQPVKWKPRKTLLDNLRVGLVGGISFQNTWMPAFKAGKAQPTLLEDKDLKANVFPTLDVIVVEDAAPAKLIALARHKNIPMVTVEWIIQTLIHGEKQDYDVWPFQDSNVAE